MAAMRSCQAIVVRKPASSSDLLYYLQLDGWAGNRADGVEQDQLYHFQWADQGSKNKVGDYQTSMRKGHFQAHWWL